MTTVINKKKIVMVDIWTVRRKLHKSYVKVSQIISDWRDIGKLEEKWAPLKCAISRLHYEPGHLSLGPLPDLSVRYHFTRYTLYRFIIYRVLIFQWFFPDFCGKHESCTGRNHYTAAGYKQAIEARDLSSLPSVVSVVLCKKRQRKEIFMWFWSQKSKNEACHMQNVSATFFIIADFEPNRLCIYCNVLYLHIKNHIDSALPNGGIIPWRIKYQNVVRAKW